jgi:PAS domain S-box-containing protein
MPILGYLAVLAQRAGLYQPPGAAVVEAVAGMIVAVVIALAVGLSLERTDARRRQIEGENREWKRFFDRATFGAVVGTSDALLWRVNKAFAQMHGYAVSELEGRPVAEVFPPYRRAELVDCLRVADERGGCRWESEHVRKDGSVFPVAIDVSVVRDDLGRKLYRAAYIQDISEEKEAEAARSRLASLVQSSEDAIVAVALDGSVLAWNRGAERVYGYSAKEMVGHSVDVIVPEDRRAESDKLRARALGGDVVVGVETERVRKDGCRIPVALTVSPIRDAAGHPIGLSTIERDISTLKRLERERQEWAAVVAHDLRQPTSAIRLATDVFLRSEANEPRKKAVDRIRRANDRLERMIGDLLDVSRVEAQHLTVQPTRVDLPSLVGEVIQLVPGLEARCRTEVAPDAHLVWADAERLVQVLSNLLSNALKYGDPDTLIEVLAERTGEMVRISVANEGPGIAADELPRLFSRFARTRSAQSGPAAGLGLGLYICRGIIEAHGGEMWAESVPGERTHFRFTLRAAGAAGESASASILRAS